MARRGELGHVEPDLGDDDLGGAWPDAGDLVEALDHPERRRSRARRGVAVWKRCLRGPHGGDALVDAGRQWLDFEREGIDGVEQHLCQLGVVLVEAAGEGFFEGAMLVAHLASREASQDCGVALSGDECLDHLAARDAHDVARHRGQLDEGVF